VLTQPVFRDEDVVVLDLRAILPMPPVRQLAQVEDAKVHFAQTRHLVINFHPLRAGETRNNCNFR
jgi:glutamine amidotransferase PdxT